MFVERGVWGLVQAMCGPVGKGKGFAPAARFLTCRNLKICKEINRGPSEPIPERLLPMNETKPIPKKVVIGDLSGTYPNIFGIDKPKRNLSQEGCYL